MNYKFLNLENIFDNRKYLYIAYPLLCVLLLCRRPDAIINPQPWAEDGPIFLHDVFCYSLNSIFLPYAGYYHPLARIVTFLSTAISPGYAILFMNLFSLFMSIFILFFFMDPLFRTFIKNDMLRLLWVILLICTPISEIYMNVTNLQWFPPIFLILYCLLILSDYDGFFLKGKIFEISIITFASLCAISSPLSIIVLPLSLYLLYQILINQRENLKNQTILKWSIPFLLCIGYFIVNSIIVETIRSNVKSINISTVFKYLSLIGNKIPNLKEFLIISLFFFIIIFLIAIVFIQLRSKNSIPVYALLTPLIFYFIILIISRTDIIFPIFFSLFNGGNRYLFIPFSIILLLLIRYVDQYRGTFLWLFSLLMLILIIGLFGYHYFLTPFTDYHFIAVLSDHLSGNITGSIPINPAPWSMTISCN